MNILEQAIQAEGGVHRLAKAIDVKPNVVTNWKSRGVPRGWEAVLVIKYKKLIAKRAKQANAEAA